MDLQRLTQYPLEVYRATLPNGLTLHVLPQARMRVHFQYTVNVGAYQDVVPGAAHFLEHVLLNDSHDSDRRSWVGAFDRRGASTNGETSWLSTNYELTGHAHDARAMLEGLTRAVYLFPAHDRAVRHERKVVRAEEFEYMEDRRLDRWMAKRRFPEDVRLHAPIIGRPSDLRTIQLEHLRRMHDQYYKPGNMLLTIAGGVHLEAVEGLIGAIMPILDSVSTDGQVLVPRPNHPHVKHERMFGTRRLTALHMPSTAHVDLPVYGALPETRQRLSFAARLLTSSNGLVTQAMRHQRGGVYGVDARYASWPHEAWQLETTLRLSEARRFFDSVLDSLERLHREQVPKELFDELRLKEQLYASDEVFLNDALDWVSPLERDWLIDDYSFEANPLAGVTLERIAEDVQRHWVPNEISSYLLTGATA